MSAESLTVHPRPRKRNNQGLESSHSVTILIGDSCSETARGSWERWWEVAAIEEKQVWNQLIALGKPGAKPNLKHWKLRAYDKRFETYAKQ